MSKPRPSLISPEPGDFVLCHQGCTVHLMGEHFELAPESGEAFPVVETGLAVPPAFEPYYVSEPPNGLRLRGVMGPDGGEPRFGMPSDRFVVCPMIEAEPGWRAYLRRLDQHRLSHFKRLLDDGVQFDDLPLILRRWWLQRY